MASILRIKRSELVGNPAILAAGELAYSAANPGTTAGGGRLYIGTGTETNFDAANHVVIGGKYFTDIVDAATNLGTNNTLVKRDGTNTAYLNIIGNVQGSVSGGITGDVTGNVTGNLSGNVTSTGTSSFNNVTVTGTVTGAVAGNVTGNVTGNLTGNVTGNASTASAWLTPRNLDLTGDATATLSNVSGAANVSAALTLATVNTNVGTYGSATLIPIVTVNAKGLVTAVSTASVASTLSVAGSTGTAGALSLLTETLTFTAGSGLKTSFNDTTNSLLIELDSAASGSLSALSVTGTVSANAITVTTTLSAGNTTVNDIAVNGNAVITGNLTVNGTMTAVNSNTVTIQDLNINVASNANTAINANGGGITVGVTLDSFTAATLNYTALDNRWNFNKDLNVANVYGALKGNADTATKWDTARNLNLTGDASGTLSSVDGSANVSGALTLATVNTNVGSYGDSVTVPNFTVNAKGLITAASSTAIPYASTSVKGLASFDSTQFSITSGAVTISTVDGGSY